MIRSHSFALVLGIGCALVACSREDSTAQRSETDRPTAGETVPAAGVQVTRVRYHHSTYSTRPGYPSTGSTTWELTADNHPQGKTGFDRLIAQVLDQTTYGGQVSLREYIALRRAGESERVAAIDAKAPRDRGPPDGSGSTTSFAMYDGKTRIYAFRHDRWDDDVYSGKHVETLAKVVRGTAPIRRESGDIDIREPRPEPKPVQKPEKLDDSTTTAPARAQRGN